MLRLVACVQNKVIAILNFKLVQDRPVYQIA